MCFAGFLANKKRSRNDKRYRATRTSTESLVNKSNVSINSVDDDSPGDNITDDEWPAPKRLALHDSDIPRYEKEFIELSLIGRLFLAS